MIASIPIKSVFLPPLTGQAIYGKGRVRRRQRAGMERRRQLVLAKVLELNKPAIIAAAQAGQETVSIEIPEPHEDDSSDSDKSSRGSRAKKRREEGVLNTRETVLSPGRQRRKMRQDLRRQPRLIYLKRYYDGRSESEEDEQIPAKPTENSNNSDRDFSIVHYDEDLGIPRAATRTEIRTVKDSGHWS